MKETRWDSDFHDICEDGFNTYEEAQAKINEFMVEDAKSEFSYEYEYSIYKVTVKDKNEPKRPDISI